MKTVIRVFALLSLAALTLLSMQSHQTMTPPLWLFLCVMLIAGVAQVLAWHYNGGGLSIRELALWAIALRIPCWLGQPLYEDDFYRYLWDGREFATSGNPYGKPPTDFMADDIPANFREILTHVNFPDIPTIYGPVCQYTFAAAYWIRPGSVGALQFVYAIFDLGLALLLLRLGIGAGGLALYLWSPLVLKEIAFTAHTDILVAFFLVATLLAIRRGHYWLAGSLCALALGSKVTAALLIPLFLVEIRTLRSMMQFGLAMVPTLAAMYLPFYRAASETEGLQAFLESWEFNSFAFAVVKNVTSFATARTVCFASAGVAVLWLAYRAWRRNQPPAYEQGLAWFYLFSPVVNPWYAVVWMPFVAMRPAPWSVLACLLLLISYATGNNLPGSGLEGFNHPWWVRPVELLPVASLAIWQWWITFRAESESRP